MKVEILQLPSDPPGRIVEAPGDGRVTTPAVLFTPPEGANIHGPAVVMLDSGPGAHPLEAGQASRFATERLAARGYTVLSLYGKQEHDFPTVRFADTVWAVKAGLDYLEQSGYEDFVLAGQDYGAIVAAQYLATQPDLLIDNGGERRVKAVILINPTTNLRAFPRAGLAGADYAERVAAVAASVKSGRGLYPKTLEPGQGAAPQTDPWIGNGVFVQPAEDCLSPTQAHAPRDTAPRTDGDCRSHIDRGASWDNTRKYVRAAAQHPDLIDARTTVFGFRIVEDLK